MRGLLTCSLVGCTAASPLQAPPQSPHVAAAPAVHKKPSPHDRPVVVELIPALSADRKDASWILPGPAALQLGGASVDAPSDAPVLEVDWLGAQGNDVRVGVRLDAARFAVWTRRARMLGVLTRDERIEGNLWTNRDIVEVVLHAGAQVIRLAHDGAGKRTKVR